MRGELDMRKMGGLRAKLKITYSTFLVATLAISGVPMLSGFFSKDEILAGAYEGPLGRPWLYWLATVTAGLTAFYMFRAVAVTFWGKSRIDPETARHLHESGSKMTTPLIVLAFFSVVAGYVSWPKAWGGTEAFDRYLAPVFGPSEEALRFGVAHPGEGIGPGALMGWAVVAALIGVMVAVWLYWKSPELPQRLARRFPRMYGVLINKFYVDEFYNWLVVEPIRAGSEKLLWQRMDIQAIDGLMVDGTGEAATSAGNLLRRIQSGNLRSYAAWILLGAVLWLGYLLIR
jgi:NADH-quinone oxidoreductase subunit L